MRIGIVDDEAEMREQLASYVKQFSKESEIEMDLALFENADKLLADYRMIYDIIIFDIDMPGTSGMDAAKRIRTVDERVTIVFVTNFAQYAINGYEVSAVDYIIKPIGYYDFSMKFHRAVSKAAQQQEHIIRINTQDGIRRLRISAVCYVEVLAHYLFFHTQKNSYKVRGNMAEIEQEIGKFNFVRTHRSYLVNMKYVEKMTYNEIIVAGNPLPLGGSYKDNVKMEYLKYVRGEE
jgi:DNA-binding LytR/AlgR family response regulator